MRSATRTLVAGASASALLLALAPLAAGGGVQEPVSGDPTAAGESDPVAPVERVWNYVAEARGVLEPSDAAFGRDGRLYVAETGAHRISVFALDDEERLNHVGTIGSGPGSGPGELFRPSGVAVAEDGRVFVADTGNHRIQIFSPLGELRGQFGSRGRGQGEFDTPLGIDVRGERVFVADSRNDRVQVLAFDGEPELVIGGFGTEEGLFDGPLDVAAAQDGSFWAVDTGNSRVQGFEPSGKYRAAFGTYGSFPGLLDGATGICWSGGRLFVAERHNHRVQVFEDESPVDQWGVHALRPREGAGKLHYPNDVAIARDGFTAVVCEGFENRIQIFRQGPLSAETELPDPRLLGTGGAPHYGARADTAQDLLVLLEPVTHSVLVFDLDADSPALIHSLCGYGRRFGRTVQPSDVVLSEDARRLWVVDRGNRRLQEFALRHNPNQQPLRFEPELSAMRQAIELDAVIPREVRSGPVDPVGIERDTQGNLYVLDARSAKIHVLDDKYTHQRSFGGWGSGSGELREPSDFAWSARGETLYVVDSHNGRVVGFSPEGEVRQSFGQRGTEPGRFTAPDGIVALRSGGVLVVDEGAHRVQVFNRAGNFERGWGSEGLGAGEFFKPKGVVEDRAGRIVVIDYGNHRGQFFDPGGKFGGAFGARLFVKETRPAKPRPPIRND